MKHLKPFLFYQLHLISLSSNAAKPKYKAYKSSAYLKTEFDAYA